MREEREGVGGEEKTVGKNGGGEDEEEAVRVTCLA